MKEYLLEVELKGELTGLQLFIEGKKIRLQEINNNHYYRKFSKFPIEELLDIHARIDGWINMKWSFKLKVNGKVESDHSGKFSHKGFVTFNEKLKV